MRIAVGSHDQLLLTEKEKGLDNLPEVLRRSAFFNLSRFNIVFGSYLGIEPKPHAIDEIHAINGTGIHRNGMNLEKNVPIGFCETVGIS